jgi:DNA-binding winged helix-turn-helix (wHTH) protein/Tfp pilus assembly protein PilF/TolB-like protein
MSSRKEIYEFANFRLDVNERTVERIDGIRIDALPDKTFETLVLLVRKHGHLVSKDEILQHVWPDTIVEENNLEKRIHQLRQFLGVNNGDGKYIETVRKHGYRFVAPVRKLDVSGSWLPETLRTSDVTTDPIRETASEHEDGHVSPSSDAIVEAANGRNGAGRWDSPGRRTLAAVGITGALLIAGLFGYFGFIRAGSAERPPVSIAILPALPINTSERSDLCEYGIPDAIINRLSPVNGFEVRPLGATRIYNKLEQDAVAAGREQKTAYVLASSYQIAGGRIKVTAQVYDVAAGKAIATYGSEQSSANLFSAQDAIANDIGHRILATFDKRDVGFQSRRGTPNEEAYTLYLLAMNLSEERGLQNVTKSLEYLDRAVALDPNYARAWAAKAHRHRDIVGHTDVGQHEHYQRSMESIAKALAIDPKLSEAYSALCHNKNRYEFDFAGAESACKRAIEFDPMSPTAYKIYANFLYSRGRFDEAIATIKRAIDIQPVSYENQQIYALTLYFARQYAESEQQFKRLLELNPTHSYIHAGLVRVLQEQRKDSEAFEYLTQLLRMQNSDDATVARMRSVFESEGWHGVLKERIRIAEGEPNPRYFQLACMHSKIGNTEKALDYLEKMYRERRFQVVMIEVEPQLDALRHEPRYIDLIRRIGSR